MQPCCWFRDSGSEKETGGGAGAEYVDVSFGHDVDRYDQE